MLLAGNVDVGILGLQCIDFRCGVQYELAVLCGLGLKGAVLQGSDNLCPLLYEPLRLIVDAMFYELLPHIFDSLCRGVGHVFCIETIVAQFVHHDFVSGEVVASFGERTAQFVDGEQ